MATKMLESSAVSAFCESVAVMHSAGIQMDEAVFLLGENMEDAAFKRACDDVYKELIVGKPLALAMDDSGCFPSHVVDMVGAGEHAGRLENVLWSLARYYDEEDRLYAKIKNAIAYPAALLCVMSAILLFTVIVILPVFVDVYHGLTGNLTAGSFGYVNASIIIGWIALGVTLLCTVLVVLGV
ncbi:type II secretion system F family protein, partial [Clostridioides difficile]|nr:type II secretion system F family protein [Clostridioides difficile]